DLLGKLGVKADMLQMGDFKGAAEPFTRSSMSPEFRQQLESVLDDFFEKSIVDTIVRARAGKGWTAEQVKKLIDQGPYTAKAAREKGLIDRVAYADQVPDLMKTALKVEQVEVVKDYAKAKSEDIDFSNPITAMMKLLSPPKTTKSPNPKI